MHTGQRNGPFGGATFGNLLQGTTLGQGEERATVSRRRTLEARQTEAVTLKEDLTWQPLSFSRQQKVIDDYHSIQETLLRCLKLDSDLISSSKKGIGRTASEGGANVAIVSPSSIQRHMRSSSPGSTDTVAASFTSIDWHNGTAGTANYWCNLQGTNAITIANDSDATTVDWRFPYAGTGDADVWNISGNQFTIHLDSFQADGDDSIVVPKVMPPAALKRAERLLRGMLTGKQKRSLDRFGFFDMPSPTKNYVAYRIPRTGLIVMYERGVAKHRLCIYENEGLPAADWMIAAKMLVEADEKDLHRIANYHTLDRHVPRDPKIDRVPLILPVAA